MERGAAPTQSTPLKSDTETDTSTSISVHSNTTNQNDDNDDIWGSSPPSRSHLSSLPRTDHDDNLPHSHSHTTSHDHDSSESMSQSIEQRHQTLSDIPALRRQHMNAGYREGLSIGKAQVMQDGFDAGYPLGVRVGLRAGVVLGILEGLVSSFESNGAGIRNTSISGSSRVKPKPMSDARNRRSRDDDSVVALSEASTHDVVTTAAARKDQRLQRLQQAKALLQRAADELKITELMRNISDEAVMQTTDELKSYSQIETVLQQWEDLILPLVIK